MARKRTFNPLAAYGTVSPPEKGAVFYQDGGYFRADGSLAFEDHPGTAEKVVETEETTVDQGKIVTKTVKTKIDTSEPGDPKEILTRWLKGDLALNHGTVRKLVKEGFQKVIAKQDEIIEFLVNDANLAPAEAVKIQPVAVGK